MLPTGGGAPTDNVDQPSFFQIFSRIGRNASSNVGTPSLNDSPAVSPLTAGPGRSARRAGSSKPPPSEPYPQPLSTAQVNSTTEHSQQPTSRRTTRPTNHLHRTSASYGALDQNARDSSSFGTYAQSFLRGFSARNSLNPTRPDPPPEDPIPPQKGCGSHSSAQAEDQRARSERKDPKNVNKQSGLLNTLKAMIRTKQEHPKPPQSLAPPAFRNIGTNLQKHRTVRIETAFPESASPKPQRQSVSHRASLHGRRAYEKSARLVRDQYGRLRRTNPDLEDVSSKNKRTDDALDEVSGILASLTQETPKTTRENRRTPLLSHSPVSGPTGPLLDYTLHRSYSNMSESSSVRELRRGINPGVSPHPDATYRARLHPDGPSQEFMKVDLISPDGPSYLPSEARRIATPPLPGEGPYQKRRGFFFDYKDPVFPQEQEEVIPKFLDDSAIQKRPQEVQRKPQDLGEGSTSDESHTITIGRSYTQNFNPGQRKKIGEGDVDWYTQKVLGIDAEDKAHSEGRPHHMLARKARQVGREILEEASHHKPSTALDSRDDRHESVTNMAKRRKVEEIDWRIPDHYPNSPLCPRHPKHKTQGTGICWMHGRNPLG